LQASDSRSAARRRISLSVWGSMERGGVGVYWEGMIWVSACDMGSEDNVSVVLKRCAMSVWERPSTASRIMSSFDAFDMEEAFDGLLVCSGLLLGSVLLSSTIDSLQNMSVRILMAPVSAGGTGRWLSHEVSLLGAIITSVTTSWQKGQTPVLTKAWRMFSFVRAQV